MKKIYIAGKVTGLPADQVELKFRNAQGELEKKGFTAVNPIEIVNDATAKWEDAMRKCIRALTNVDAVYLLPCYVDSKGAQLELLLAHKLGIPVCTKVDGFLQIQSNLQEINN